ncbi:MAG: class IIb bacteriocin, lactobin A/cerein 7B family [Mediterranea sp.]|jgi:lactobin A/cerein 7B family class IIb bacteriocin|nr:class IIb bacteriocin, lactobin A/cerein 7B family [Mediterranea sp.]
MEDLTPKEMMEINGGAIGLIIVGLLACAVGVCAGVAVAEYYLK